MSTLSPPSEARGRIGEGMRAGVSQGGEAAGPAKALSVEAVLLALTLAFSLALRLMAPDAFVTSDEDNWQRRTVAFEAALRAHDWAATYQVEHPGVVTMWLGVAAEHLPFLSRPWTMGWLREVMGDPAAAPGTGVPALTIAARRLVGITTWLGIVALCFLLRKLYDARISLLATAIVGLDPFFLALSRVHHLDAILSTFMALSVVCLLIYEYRGRRIRYVVASGVAAGLAIANKSPGMFLAPWAVLALLWPIVSAPAYKRRQVLWKSVAILALWGGIAALVLFAIWPALWVNPVGSLREVFASAQRYADAPHQHSNFFWFAERPDPGFAFYPVAWLFRTTPWVVLGLISLAALWRRQRQQAPTLLLLSAGLLMVAVMTVGAKKFDRYILPSFVLFDIAAAVGWAALLQRWRASANRWWAVAALTGILALTQLAMIWRTRPYYFDYYNPLVGGSRTAPDVLLIGWGEGLDRAAAYLNSKPNAADLTVGSWHDYEFSTFFVGETIHIKDATPVAAPEYYVLYSSVVQRNLLPEIAPPLLERGQPEYTVVLNGIPYAWVYKNTVYQQAEEEILGQINAMGNPDEDVILVGVDALFAHSYADRVPLQVHTVQRDDAICTVLQRIATGRKHIWHLIYPDATDGAPAMLEEHLRQVAVVGDEIVVDGVRAVRYDLPPEPHFVPVTPSVASNVRLGDQIVLTGYDAPQTELVPGQQFSIRMHWRAQGQVAGNCVTFVHLIGPGEQKYGQIDSAPQGWKWPTSAWIPGETVVDDYTLDVSPDAPPGEYAVVVGMYDATTHDRLPIYSPTGDRLDNDCLILNGFSVAEGAQP